MSLLSLGQPIHRGSGWQRTSEEEDGRCWDRAEPGLSTVTGGWGPWGCSFTQAVREGPSGVTEAHTGAN